MSYLVLFCYFRIAIISLGEERELILALFDLRLFPLPLGVCKWLRFVNVALPGLFFYLILFYEAICFMYCLVLFGSC